MSVSHLPKTNGATSFLDETAAKALAEKLSTVLANNMSLYLQTQGYHWNVTGPHFYSLHRMFEEQYTNLATTNDDLAERIRSLGHVAPVGFKTYLSLSTIEVDDPAVPSSAAMLQKLVQNHSKLAAEFKELFALASSRGDETTASLAASRLEWHEKTLWMLRSSL